MHSPQLGQLNVERVRALYAETLQSFISKKHTHLHLSFFIDAFRRYPALGGLVSQDVVDACRMASKPYAHTQAFGLLDALLKLPVRGFLLLLLLFACWLVGLSVLFRLLVYRYGKN